MAFWQKEGWFPLRLGVRWAAWANRSEAAGCWSRKRYHLSLHSNQLIFTTYVLNKVLSNFCVLSEHFLRFIAQLLNFID